MFATRALQAPDQLVNVTADEGSHSGLQNLIQIQQTERPRGKIGVLQSLLAMSTAKEHLASAVKRSSRVAYSAGLRNEAEKERNKAARQMDTLMKEMTVPLTKSIASFPKHSHLHPFEQALLELTVGLSNYENAQARVDSLRKSLQETGKSYASKASKAVNKAAALQAASEGLEHMVNLYSSGAKHVDILRDMGKKLRSLPLVDVSLPTIALVGAPNVGKSSLVKLMSTGTPEVCNYPFTTRSIKMGHFYIDGKKHQITDTPGLLNRNDADRNKMEMLTLAVLQHLPTSVLFVIDLTEECGTSVEDQWAIRSEVKRRFPGKPWVDVLSKSDALSEILEAGHMLRNQQQQLLLQGKAESLLHVGDLRKINTEYLNNEVSSSSGTSRVSGSTSSTTSHAQTGESSAQHLEGGASRYTSSEAAEVQHLEGGASRYTSSEAAEVPAASDDMQLNGTTSSSSTSSIRAGSPSSLDALPSSISGPEEIVALLPEAQAVSSLTEEGLPVLKDRLMTLLSQHYMPSHDPGWADNEEADTERGTIPTQEAGVYADDTIADQRL
ncbi:hypothetical protein CEUSTIGMA_g12547.t1 [Chlamydomonas eustigma]|uniref:OBG-type G domain-containing protein n=1 Tax=Chlamydomonas eustigma TaxID=1157962 RepID=A0A250XPX8_9CHLO|nr:hypothetical protein CEUSTIGMA_g12547.t1 [Chlamydomonas eustigma]|eukprot:GAX85127.1 hypothetical protein CEUSTIGMA_g12547.t1 [Chlamydomonas eustigma]